MNCFLIGKINEFDLLIIKCFLHTSKNKKICNKVIDPGRDANKLLQSYVLAMGRTKKRVLVITKDLDVFDDPADCFDSSRNITYLKYMSTPMKDKYPVLYDNSIFKKIKNNMIAWIMYDSDGDWICMTSNDSKQAINYNIDTSKIYEGYVLSGEWPEILIASQEPCKCYSIQIRDDKENKKNPLWLTAYKCKNGDRIINSDGIEKVTDFRIMCFENMGQNNVLLIEGKKCDNEAPIEWPFSSGFVSDGKFFIIGYTINYIFSENFFFQKGKKFALTIVNNKVFFKCGGIVPPDSKSCEYRIYCVIFCCLICRLF